MIVHKLEDNNNRLERQVKHYKEENDQMLRQVKIHIKFPQPAHCSISSRLIHQYQSEMHSMNK
jgi:hypothetical protein